ncbi:MAG: glycosyl transferase family protein [Limisphaerales bacterium]|nr:MAG: glycosyl transferase family protein [Limisphaerales bacterium]KAG0506814.1 MAG: glycosyl transferase family protein [Limisphaerales bacterium]TXT45519.1 MAG: glycosyl transferase family protein [Limisphaerales bacterium]
MPHGKHTTSSRWRKFKDGRHGSLRYSPSVRVSIVLPAFNEEKLIGATLQTVNTARIAFEAIGWESEVVVCDNNSTDRTGEIARAAGAKVVFEPVNQIARARNAGAAAATGDWLIFVDADSQVNRDLFAEVAEVIRGGAHLAGGCIIRLDHAPWWTAVFLHLWTLTSRVCRWAAGSFVFAESEAFRAVGGFNQALYATEEIDLSQRLNRLARRRQLQPMRILTRHPLLTSGRKARLYTPWEHLRFMLRTALSLGRSLNRRDACPIWYDGRR